MSVITVLKVFKHSILITPQGEFKIERFFATSKAARKARYFYYFTDSGVKIFIRKTAAGNKKYAAVGN
jgi:hypothetical protein